MLWFLETVIFLTFLIVMIVARESVNDYQEFCSINTKSGRLRGKLKRTLYDQTAYYSFLGIPFGKPPIGHLRFKAPQKIDPWNGTLDAIEFQNDCLQFNSTIEQPSGSEDCLYLNVYVPTKCSSLNPTTKLPVIFHIYGGGFTHGTPRLLLPDFIMETNVILVLVNYRMDIFGFLTLGTPEYSGNMGLKDNILALRWVNENIEQFGGDKYQISVVGHSSGSASVEFIMASSKGKNLFQKAILMSGSALNLIDPNHDDHFTTLSNIATRMSYPIFDKDDAIEFLQQIDGTELIKMTFQPSTPGLGRRYFGRIFRPCIEEKNAIDPFLTESPFDIFTNSNYQPNIDAMYMTSAHESTLIDEEKNPALLENFDKMFQMTLPLAVPHLDFRSEVYKRISDRIRMFYFNGGHLNKQTLPQVNDLMSDCNFLYPIDLSARIHSTKSTGRTFFSRFSVTSEFNYSAKFAKLFNITMSRTHVDICYFIFRDHGHLDHFPDEDYRNLEENSLDRRMIKSTTNFFANFVKYSNPMPGSDPVTFRNPNTDYYYFYDITNDGIRIETDVNRDHMEFWNDIFNENKQLLDTDFDFRTT